MVPTGVIGDQSDPDVLGHQPVAEGQQAEEGSVERMDHDPIGVQLGELFLEDPPALGEQRHPLGEGCVQPGIL